MSDFAGRFVYRELMTPDRDASVRFYTEVFGWATEVSEVRGIGSFVTCKLGARPIAGIQQRHDASIPPMWAPTVRVDDVAAAVARATDAGAAVMAPPTDTGSLGRFAALRDAQGALFYVWSAAAGSPAAAAQPAPPARGQFCWEQLNTGARTEAFTFYAKTFGWTHAPMGGAAAIEVFSTGATQVASVVQTPPGVPAHWLSYVVVDTLPAAAERVTKHGGVVLVERIEVPGMGAIGVIQDSTGAALGIFEAA